MSQHLSSLKVVKRLAYFNMNLKESAGEEVNLKFSNDSVLAGGVAVMSPVELINAIVHE